MAATFVKVTKLQNSGGSGTTDVSSGAVVATAGNALIVVAGAYYDASTAHAPTLAVSGGGTWTSHSPAADHHFTGNDNMCFGFASCPSATGGSQTVTITWTLNVSSSSHVGTAWVYEFSGMPASALLDLLGTAAFGTTSPITVTALTNANATDVLLAGAVTMSGSNETHGAPANSWIMPSGGDETNVAFLTGVSAYKIVSASASQSTSWTDSPVPAGWLSYAIALKQGAGATTFPISRSITQAQTLALTTSKVFLRTVSLTQPQSATVAVRPTVRYSLSGTVTQAQSLSVAVLQARLPNNYYTTAFPLTENPISESNVWSLGKADALDWNNPRTTPGRVFGTQSGTDNPPYTDSIAVLKGTWGNDQEASATIFGVAPPSGAYYTEVELLLRFTVTAHSVVGYEVTISVNASNNYIQVNRWTGGPYGSLSSYVQVGATTFHTISNGDVMRATIVGSTITLYQNGTQILQVTDTNVTTGKPGIGFYNQDNGAHADPASYGFANYTAHTIGTPWPLGGTILQGQSLRLVQQTQIRRALSQVTALVLAQGARLSRVLAQPQTVSLSVASRIIPLVRSVTQATSASLSLRKVILRVVNTTQGQALQFVRLTHLSRAVTESEALNLTIQSSGGGPIHPMGGTCSVSTAASLTWTWRPAPAPPRPTRPVTPPLVSSPADLAPVLTLAATDLPPALQPAYAPVVPPS